jgi:hypothetical protein
MTNFTAESPLYFVMRHAEGNRIISERVPTLANNPLLHTLYFHEVGMILGTEEALQGKPAEVAEILRLIGRLEPEDTVAQRAAAAAGPSCWLESCSGLVMLPPENRIARISSVTGT